MKRLLYLLLVPLLLMSCKDDFDISRLQDSSHLVVYSFPTEGDTTLIFVCKSVPVSTAKGDLQAQSAQTVDAHIIYNVNGVECPVKRIESTEDARLVSDATNDRALQQLVGHYYAVGKQKSGDHIHIEVAADGFSTVSASTYIPQRVDAKIDDMQHVTEAGDNYSMDRLLVSFDDDGASKDYYAVRVNKLERVGEAVCIYRYKYKDEELGVDTFYVHSYYEYQCMAPEKRLDGEWNFDSIGTVKSNLMVDTDKEPILNKSSKINEDLGFDDYQYYKNMYCFDDQLLNGKKYTLHLGLLSAYNWNNWGEYYYTGDWDQLYGYTYQVELCKLTPEYYRYLSSINNAQNNSWAEVGIMQVTPTYSNVKGGFGVVAGYNTATDSKYIEPPKNQDGIYTK